MKRQLSHRHVLQMAATSDLTEITMLKLYAQWNPMCETAPLRVLGALRFNARHMQ